MKPFEKPKYENYIFTTYSYKQVDILGIEEEIKRCIEVIISNSVALKSYELSMIYYESNPATTQYVITISDKLDYQDDFWIDISLQMFLLLSDTTDFEFLYENSSGKVYNSKSLTPYNFVKLLNTFTREYYIKQILKTV